MTSCCCCESHRRTDLHGASDKWPIEACNAGLSGDMRRGFIPHKNAIDDWVRSSGRFMQLQEEHRPRLPTEGRSAHALSTIVRQLNVEAFFLTKYPKVVNLSSERPKTGMSN